MASVTLNPTAWLIWLRLTAEPALDASPPCEVTLVQATGRGEPDTEGVGKGAMGAEDAAERDAAGVVCVAGPAGAPQPDSSPALSNPQPVIAAAQARRGRAVS